MTGWWTVSYVVLWVLVVVLCLVVVALARQIGTLYMRLGPRGALEIDGEGPGLGEAPPPLAATAIGGDAVSIGGPGRAQLLMFVSPGCHLCEQVLPSLHALSDGDPTPVVISDGDAYETTAGVKLDGLPAPVVPAAGIAREYNVPGTPYVVILDELGVVRAKGTVNNLEQVEGLIETARSRTDVALESHAG